MPFVILTFIQFYFAAKITIVQAYSTCFGESQSQEVPMDQKIFLGNSNNSFQHRIDKIPKRLKDLLETGLLEGLPVRYIHRSKGTEFELLGIIKGTCILCSCDECKGQMVITPNQFELHAHSRKKRPPENIYLKNGKSLHNILDACKAVEVDSLEKVIQDAIGQSCVTTTFCLQCEATISEAGVGGSMLCDSCFGPMFSGPSTSQISDSAHTSPLTGSFAPGSFTSTPKVSKSAEIGSSAKPKMKRQGKLTWKDLRMHKLVFAKGGLAEGTELGYFIKGEKKLEGYKKGSGICCTCCGIVMSPSKFEAHAGYKRRRKPYMSIYTSKGISLHNLSIELSKNREPSLSKNDNLCSIYKDEEDSLCCQNCARDFHRAERSIRIVESIEFNGSACAICRLQDFTDSNSGFDDRTIIICDQCEKEYHIGCLREQQLCDLEDVPNDEWFCSTPCGRIYFALHELIRKGEQKLTEASLEIVRKKHKVQGLRQNLDLNVSWRMFRGVQASEESRMWLSGAVSIFHDQFDRIYNPDTRHDDLIPDMVHGRELKDQDFCNMYSAVLIVDSVVACAAIFRIFGEEVAELPLVATRSDNQGKGYFQALYFCIENLLTSLNVKDLVLPAAAEAESMWTNKFGFVKLGREKLNEYKKFYQMRTFHGASIFHKSLSHP